MVWGFLGFLEVFGGFWFWKKWKKKNEKWKKWKMKNNKNLKRKELRTRKGPSKTKKRTKNWNKLGNSMELAKYG